MPSLLARLRSRVVNGSSTQSPQSSTTLPSEETRILDTPPLLVDRRIRPDLHTLFDAYAAEDTPKPNVRASSHQSPVPEHSGPTPLQPPLSGRRPVIQHRDHEPVKPTPLFSTRERGSRNQASNLLPSSGTFGRQSHQVLDLEPPNRFNSLPARIRPLNEAEGERSLHLRRSKTRSRPTVLNSQRQPTKVFEFSTLFTTECQRSDSSTKTPSTHSSKSRSVRISTPVVHPLGFDSPHTFGHLTPPSTRESDHSIPGSPPPPLPALHQESTTFPDILHTSLTSGRPIRTYSSLPRVNSLFFTSANDHASNYHAHRRANTMSSASTKTSRRSSAEWSAYQATSGVLSNSRSWPAEVSREILRLSFAESEGVIISHQNPGNRPRANNETVTNAAFPSPLILDSPILLQTGDEPASSLVFPGGDWAELGGDKEGSSHEDKKMHQVVSNGQHTVSTKGKAPLKSSLRMSSSPVANLPVHFTSFAGVTADLITSEPRQNVPSSSDLLTPSTKGKRKADEVDVTHPEQKRTQFAVPEKSRRTSSDPRAPSSYRVKRARLSGSTPSPSPSPEASPSQGVHTGSSAGGSQQQIDPHGKQSPHTGSIRSYQPGSDRSKPTHKRRSISSLSHTSIPLSALVSPHAPSVSRSLTSAYHMRDPRRPPKIQSTAWSLRRRTEFEDGSPIHAWLFFLGFVIFPVWWAASVWKIPETRRFGEDMEKAVTLDDPQIEHDARSWRLRCRIVSVISVFTYVPFIVLVVIFTHR